MRLTEFYAQFRGVANNYNQCVRTIHTIYGDKKSLAYLYKLTAETLKMEHLIMQVIAIVKEFRAWYAQGTKIRLSGKDIARMTGDNERKK